MSSRHATAISGDLSLSWKKRAYETILHRLSAGLVAAHRLAELSHNRFRKPTSLVSRNLYRFRRLVLDLLTQSPYYSKIIKERGIDPNSCSVTDFPPLTKDLLLEHFNDIITDKRVTKAGVEEFLSRSRNPLELFKGDFFVVHTSGSSGQIAPFVWHKMDWLRGLINFSRAVPTGILRKLAFVGAIDGHYAGVTMSQSGAWGPLWWTSRVKVFDIRKPRSELVAELNAYRPVVLTGYSTALRELALERDAGQLKICPRTIVSAGEPLFAGDRELIESVFGVPVTNVYAASEHMIIGIGLSGLDGMVLQEDDLIIEPLKDHTLITNLLNKTLPLIRYRMDDVLLPLDSHAARWPAYRMVGGVAGRREYAPSFLNEAGQLDTIHPIVLVEFFVHGLEAFQIVVHDATSFTFLAVIRKDRARSETIADICDRLNDVLTTKRMRNVTYKVEITDHLSVDKLTGKFQLIRTSPSEACAKL